MECWSVLVSVSPSQIRHIWSGSSILNLPDHCQHIPHPPHHQNLQDRSDCPLKHSTSPWSYSWTFWLSIWTLQQITYYPALVESLSLGLQHTVLPLQSLYPHNHWFISLSPHLLNRAFNIFSPLHSADWIASSPMLLRLGHCAPPSLCWVDLLYDVIVLIGMCSCSICLPEGLKCSFSGHWLWIKTGHYGRYILLAMALRPYSFPILKVTQGYLVNGQHTGAQLALHYNP